MKKLLIAVIFLGILTSPAHAEGSEPASDRRSDPQLVLEELDRIYEEARRNAVQSEIAKQTLREVNDPVVFAAQTPAPGRGLRDVPEAHVARLAALHAEAEHQVIENDFDAALKIYDEILLVEPDDATAYANAGQIHLILGKFDKARAAFENALDIDPENELAYRGLRRILDPDARAEEPEDPASSPA